MAGKTSQQGRERRRLRGMGLPVSWRTLPSIPRVEGGRARLPELSGVSGTFLTLTKYLLFICNSNRVGYPVFYPAPLAGGTRREEGEGSGDDFWVGEVTPLHPTPA